MGVVTCFTLARGHDAVNAVCFFRKDGFVAIDAEPGHISRQQPGMIRCVGVVTPGTLSFFQQRVQVGPGQNIFKVFVAFQAQLSFGTGLQFKFILGKRRRGKKQYADDAQCEKF